MEDKEKSKFLHALDVERGIVRTACTKTDTSRAKFNKWMREDPDFKQRAEEIQENQIDIVESQLIQKIEAGDTTAIIFYLKTKGKRRGYTEKALPPAEVPQAKALPEPKPALDSKAIGAKVRSKKAYIVKLLKKQGKYTAELTYQVEITAQLLVRAEILGDEILADGHKVVNVEYSREGNERVTLNPKEKLYLDVLEKGQKALRALGMNTESKERKSDNDSATDFFASIKMEDDE